MEELGAAGTQWFLARDGQQFGPISDAELGRLAGTGRLRPTDHVWRHGFETWLEARMVPGLIPVFAMPPPPPPPALPVLPATFQGHGVVAQFAPSPGVNHHHGPSIDPRSADAEAQAGARHYGPADPRTQPSPAGGQVAPVSPSDSTTLAMINYVLLFIFPVIGLVLALVNKDSQPAWIATHYKYQWRTLAKGFLYVLVAAATIPIGIGLVLLLLVVVWNLGRIIGGMVTLGQRRPIANYKTWLW